MYKYYYDTRQAITILLHRGLRSPHSGIFLRIMAIGLLRVCEALHAFAARKNEEMATNGQIIYLERLLNATFNGNESFALITITDNLAADEPAYIGNAGDEQAALDLGNVWDSGAVYSDGEEVIYAGLVWQSISDDNEANEPSADSEYWQSPTDPQEPAQYVGSPTEYTGGLFFIVNITAANYAAIEPAAMSAIIDRYKLFGVTYTYNIYEEV